MALPGLDGNEQRCWLLFLDSSMRILATVNGSLMATHGLTLLDVLLLDLLAHSDRGAVRMSALADQHSAGSSPSGRGGLPRGAVGLASPGRGVGVWAFVML